MRPCKRTLFATVVAGALIAVASAQTRQQEIDLQAAIRTETIDGDLRAAIAQYEAITAKYRTDRPIAAQALLRMAECYQKLGDAEARRIYERILREYIDQTDAAALARARLGAARPAADPVIALRKVWDGDISGTIDQDGRRLSYNDWGAGHIGVRNLDDGRDHPVTASDYTVFQSAISRDGTQVAYAAANNEARRFELRVTGTKGNTAAPPRTLVANADINEIDPMDWSPDGKFIAVSLRRADQTAQIALVAVTDGALRVLKSVDWRGPTRIFFSPSGREIGFDLPAGDGTDQRDVFVLAVDGSRETPVVVHPSQDVMMGWSPDGRHLLFASDRRDGTMGLWAVAIADGKPQGTAGLVKANIGTGWSLGVTSSGSLYLGTHAGDQDIEVMTIDLTTGKAIGDAVRPIQTYVGSNTQPRWSPDGKFLAYVSARGFKPNSNRDRIVVVESLDTGKVRELRPRLSYFNQLNWAPDGRSLVTGGTDAKGREGVFRIDTQTGEATALLMSLNGRNSYPQLSSDGKLLYYRRQVRTGSAGVIERDLQTGREREVVGDGYGLGPVNLSPDGQWIVLQKGSNQSGSMLLIPVRGGEPREVLRASPPDRFAHHQGMPWTPDGRGFLVRKRLTKTSELWFVPIAGEPRKLEIDASSWATGPVGAFSLHPDGRRLAFLRQSREPVTQVWALENFLPLLEAAR